MRITVDIDEKTIKSVINVTGIKKRSPAVSKAVSEYCVNQKRKHFLERIISGGSDYSLTNDALEKAVYDTD